MADSAIEASIDEDRLPAVSNRSVVDRSSGSALSASRPRLRFCGRSVAAMRVGPQDFEIEPGTALGRHIDLTI